MGKKKKRQVEDHNCLPLVVRQVAHVCTVCRLRFAICFDFCLMLFLSVDLYAGGGTLIVSVWLSVVYQSTDVFAVHYLFQVADNVHIEYVYRQIVFLAHGRCREIHDF